MEHIDPLIVKLIEQQETLGGIDLSKLPAGTKINVKTKNTLYKLETTDEPRRIFAQGGKRLPEKELIYFNGSTWGGSMIKLDWIGFDMHMEMIISEKTILTSAVQSAIIHGDNWYYEMNWSR